MRILLLLHPRQPPPEVPPWVPTQALTRVRLLGVLLALPADDEHEDEQEDEDEPHQGDDHQEPPLLVEGVGFLGWGTQQEGSEGQGGAQSGTDGETPRDFVGAGSMQGSCLGGDGRRRWHPPGTPPQLPETEGDGVLGVP